MDSNSVRGLLGSAGKALARLARSEEIAARLESAETGKEVGELLGDLDLGVSEPARSEIVDALSGADWDANRWALIKAWNVAYHNRLFPSS